MEICWFTIDKLWNRTLKYISKISKTAIVVGNHNANPPVPKVAAATKTSATFEINNAKLYLPVVSLSINAYIKFSGNIKQGFKKTISCNKYRSEIVT